MNITQNYNWKRDTRQGQGRKRNFDCLTFLVEVNPQQLLMTKVFLCCERPSLTEVRHLKLSISCCHLFLETNSTTTNDKQQWKANTF